MVSPVLELQQRVLDHDIPASTLARFALLIAKRVRDEKMAQWCADELGGYKKSPKDLAYRVAYGEYMASDRWGRDVPVMVKEPKVLDIITKVPIWMSLGEIEAMLSGESNATSWKMYLPPEMEAKLREGMSRDVTRLFRLVQRQQLAQVLEAVRSRLFDWTVELQANGIAIDGADFPELPRRKGGDAVEAARSIKTETYVEVREASQSPVQVGTRNSSQETSYKGIDADQVRRMVDAMEADLKGMPQGDVTLRKLMDELQTIRNVLDSPAAKPSWISEGLRSVKHMLENAAGTVLGEALKDSQYIAQIGRMLGMP